MQTIAEPTPTAFSQGAGEIFRLVSTYVVVLVLLFFSVGGIVPSTAGPTLSLESTANASTTLLGTLFQGGAWAMACVIMASNVGSIYRACLEVKPLALLSLLALASSLWSLNPSNSFRRGIFLLLTTLFAVYLVEKFKAIELAQMLVLTGVVIGLLGILVSIADPAIGRDARNGGAWQGVFSSKNGCAQDMIFLLSPAICFRFSRRWMRLLSYTLYLVAAILIIMSRAKTAWLLCPGLILLIVWLAQLRKVTSRTARFAVFATVASVVTLLLLVPLPSGDILQVLGKESTLSGRVPLWTGVLGAIAKRPLLGYGYDAFWQQGLQGEVLNIFMFTRFETFQAQSGFLEVWLELGLVGLALIFLSLGQAARDAFTSFRYGDPSSTRWYIGIIALAVIYNMDESYLALSNSLPWLLYILACAGLAQEARKLRTRRDVLHFDPVPAFERRSG